MRGSIRALCNLSRCVTVSATLPGTFFLPEVDLGCCSVVMVTASWSLLFCFEYNLKVSLCMYNLHVLQGKASLSESFVHFPKWHYC